MRKAKLSAPLFRVVDLSFVAKVDGSSVAFDAPLVNSPWNQTFTSRKPCGARHG
jgi:hypothetical protein